jgi:hypothetical protein
VTELARLRHFSASREPMNPVPPVISTFIRLSRVLHLDGWSPSAHALHSVT